MMATVSMVSGLGVMRRGGLVGLLLLGLTGCSNLGLDSSLFGLGEERSPPPPVEEKPTETTSEPTEVVVVPPPPPLVIVPPKAPVVASLLPPPVRPSEEEEQPDSMSAADLLACDSLVERMEAAWQHFLERAADDLGTVNADLVAAETRARAAASPCAPLPKTSFYLSAMRGVVALFRGKLPSARYFLNEASRYDSWTAPSDLADFLDILTSCPSTVHRETWRQTEILYARGHVEKAKRVAGHLEDEAPCPAMRRRMQKILAI